MRTFRRVLVMTLLAVLAISAAINVFSFDRNAGAFADRMAERIVENLGERSWFVTDGTLDDHLRLAARRLDREVKPSSFATASEDMDGFMFP